MVKIKHSVDGMRPIVTIGGCMKNGERYTAEIFAKRLARREFGRNGQVAAFRCDCWREDGSYERFEAFIGRHSPYGGISGHNVWIEVENKCV